MCNALGHSDILPEKVSHSVCIMIIHIIFAKSGVDCNLVREGFSC